jgi:TonB family protein
MIPPAIEISYDRNSFPTPLEGEADWRKHIRKGHIGRATRVMLSRHGAPSQFLRADEVPELLAIFEEFDPTPPEPPAPAPAKPRRPRPAPPAAAPAPADGGDLWQALQDYIALVARRGSRPSDFAALTGRFDHPLAVRLDAAGALVVEPFDPADPNQLLVALGDGEKAAVVPTYDYVANFDLAFSEPVQNPPAVRQLFDMEAGEGGLRVVRMAVVELSGGVARLKLRGRLGGFRSGAAAAVAAPLSTAKTEAPPPLPHHADDEAASPAANPLVPWLVIGGLLLLMIFLFAQNGSQSSRTSEVQPPAPTYAPEDRPEMNAPAPLPETAPPPTYPTSFDCAVATLPSERMICETQDIATQDVEMARLYSALLARLPPTERGRAVDEQTAWRRDRDACANEAETGACLRRAYAMRIEQLGVAVAAPMDDGAEDESGASAGPAGGVMPAPSPPERNLSEAVRPQGNSGNWISGADYPDAARARGESGRSGFALDVDETGRVTRCAIVSSSGSALLDEATCRIVPGRARFWPARDARGNPVRSIYQGGVRWSLSSTK